MDTERRPAKYQIILMAEPIVWGKSEFVVLHNCSSLWAAVMQLHHTRRQKYPAQVTLAISPEYVPYFGAR